jgi:DNA-binding transcriptional LysR family regulator
MPGRRIVDLDKLDLRKLRAFHLVARHGNLRLAAARLNQTVPAISSKLKHLERDLGLDLFERLPNKLILTATGERFLREVDAVFARAEQALAAVAPGTAPTGRVAVSIGTDHDWFSVPKISAFIKRYPGAALSLQVYRASDALRALSKGELDVSIGVFPPLPRTLEREVIAESTLSLACPPGHPLLRPPAPRLADIARHTLIVLPRHAETRKLVDRALARAALKPASLIEAANCNTVMTFVARGVGVGIAHTLCLSHLASDAVQRIDLGHALGRVEFCVVYRRGAAKTPLVRGLLEELLP